MKTELPDPATITKSRRFNAVLDPEVWRSLIYLALTEGKSMSQVVSDAVLWRAKTHRSLARGARLLIERSDTDLPHEIDL